MELLVHVALFLGLSLPIVVLSAFYSEQDDAAAFRGLPRRYVVFVLSCALLTAVMLFFEHTFAGVD